MEDLLKGLKLSEAELREVSVEDDEAEDLARDPQAFGKLISKRPVGAILLERTLGRIWCPSKGTLCKELGNNTFLFTFLQASGKFRVLDEGPWMFNRDLLVMTDFDPHKTVEELEFNTIPLWVRISSVPVGKMNRSTAEGFVELLEVE